MSRTQTAELAAAAARLVVDEGMEYALAKRKAARALASRAELPSSEAVEAEVRAYLALYCADTQPAELRALRRLALRWMLRLAAFRPHLAGAAWRGTATRLSALHLDLYCDDTKAMEIALINLGVSYDSASLPAPRQGRGGEPVTVLSVADHSPELGDLITLHLTVRDLDDLRGALKPDAQGRSWRGDASALRRLIDEGEAE
ncbi:MAG: hypothetical protein V4792_13365 [Pseudomonadota bacterium]